MATKKMYQVKYKLKDKKTGRVTSTTQSDVLAESETNAAAEIKRRWSIYDVEITAVNLK